MYHRHLRLFLSLIFSLLIFTLLVPISMLNAAQDQPAATLADETKTITYLPSQTAGEDSAAQSNTANAKQTVTDAGSPPDEDWTYTYDANGNMINRVNSTGTYTFTYNAINKLATAMFGTTTITYTYDGNGDLVKKVTDDGTTMTTDLYISDHYAILDAGGPNENVRKSYYLNGELVAVRNDDELAYILSDHLGSASVSTDITGTVISEQRYYPYGELRWSSGGDMPTEYQFTAQRAEDSLGLYDFDARYYDPYINRFIQPDSIVPDPASPQTLNRYMYTAGNPLRYIDPSGHWYYDPGCDCLVKTDANYNERPENLYRLTQPLDDASTADYQSHVSAAEALEIVVRWARDYGNPYLVYGPERSLTQDVQYSDAVEQFYLAWKQSGFPIPFTWTGHSIDDRDQPFDITKVINTASTFGIANVNLVMSTIGLGSQTPEGAIDPVDGFIGSFDEISIHNAGFGMAYVRARNTTGLASFTRIPGTDITLCNNVKRSNPDINFGANLVQTFYWYISFDALKANLTE